MLADWLDRLQTELAPLSDSAALDAQVLLAQVMGHPRAWILAHPEAELTTGQKGQLAAALERLQNGAPLPYVLGHWEFYGLDFVVTPDTLIPRPETEHLVEQALLWLQAHPSQRRAVDVGTGSGCIAVTLASQIRDLQILATDVSWHALRIARQNALRHHVSDRIEFVASDLLVPFFGSFDLICANLPYIPARELQDLDVAQREPWSALDGGADGLFFIRRLMDLSPRYLVQTGLMLLEIGASQGEGAYTLARSAFPTADIQILKDLAGRDRILQVSLTG